MRAFATPVGRIFAATALLLLGELRAASAEGLRDRDYLLGDWLGARTTLADKGITFANDITQFHYGVTSGGLKDQFSYAGHGDYVTNFDFGKMGVQEGLFLKLRAEHRFGQSISGNTGTLLPATIQAQLPSPNSEDIYLTDVLFTQFLSDSIGVFAGKLDTFDGDMNAFASGRGKTQFSNLAFVINPVALRTMPYSTLGCGFVVMHEGETIWQVSVLNSVDTSGTSGFDELFDEGASIASQLRLPTNFFNKPGHQLLATTYSTRNYVALGQDPRVLLPSVPLARTEDSWSVFWNCDQYLISDPHDPTRGWGYFARAGIADAQSNPMQWLVSAGLGGSSPLRCRPADTFGVGYYYLGTSNQIGTLLTSLLGPIGDEQGVEMYYNVAVRKFLHVTADLQVLDSARENVPTAVVVGLRSKVDF